MQHSIRRLAARAAVLSALLLAAGLPLATAMRAKAADDPVSAAAGADGRALAAALDTIRADNISADIHFIAADEMQGRDTPSEGLRITARYIRARLQRLGLEPGAADGYFHHYPLSKVALDDANTHLRVARADGQEGFELKLGSDFWYRSSYLMEDVTSAGKVVFAGGGTKDELDEIDVKDAWALVLDGGEAGRGARRAARAAGALGVILVPSADYDGRPYAESYGSGLDSLRQGRVTFPRKESTESNESSERSGRRRFFFPQLNLTRAAGLRLLGDAEPALGADLGLTVTDERRLLAGGGEIQMENVCGFWRGSDPELSKDVILLSAHYDHVGARDGKIWNGADDNGSGTTGLLQIAEALTRYGPMRRSVMLIWVSGEEKGLWGSRAWAQDPWLPEGARPVADLNIDMIGRNAPDELYITPTETHDKYNFIVALAQKLAPLEGFPRLEGADEYYGRSDQAEFEKLGIPVAFLFAGVHEDYHQPTDTPDKIDCDKLRRVARLVVRLLDALQGDTLGA